MGRRVPAFGSKYERTPTDLQQDVSIACLLFLLLLLYFALEHTYLAPPAAGKEGRLNSQDSFIRRC